MRKFLLAATAAVTLAAPAQAADMSVKARPAAVVAAAYNWTGFYVGLVGGGGWADTRHTNNINGANSGTVGISGGLLGGTYGYNAQFGSWVLGVEGDFSWSGIKGSFNDTGSGFCVGVVQCETSLRWFGTNRARLGYAADRLFIYGTAGVAYGNVSGFLTNVTPPPTFVAGNNTRAAFVYGAGVEWGFAPAWSVKAEYLRTDLGDQATYGTTALPLLERVSLKNLDIVRVGVNYRFGGPLVARY